MATTINANLRINTSEAYRDVDVFKSRINKSFSQPLGRISGDAAEFSKSLQAAAARVTAFGATTGSIYLVTKAISETAKATIEVNKQLTELNTFLGESQSNLNNFSKSLFSIARNAGATFSDAAEAAKEFARQGLSTQETLTRTNDALVLSRISGLNYAQSVNSITTALNGFSKEALTSTEIINKLIAVDTRFAVSSRDLSEALTRVGSAAEEAGLSSDQLVATITTAQQITGRGGAVIGNALKTIFTRVRRPEILDQLKQIGVVVTDQNGSLLNAIDILKNYTNVTKNLSQAEKSRTAELLGGVYQINQLQSVIRDLGSANSIYANSLKISIGATDEAIKKNAELNKSYAALINETKTVALQVGADIGKSLFGPIISGGAGLTKQILSILSPEEIEPQISKTGQKIGNTLSKEIGRGVLDTLGNALAFVGTPIAAVVGAAVTQRLGKFLLSSVKTQIKEVTDPLGRVITGGSYSGQKEKEELNLQNQIADVIKKKNFIGEATIKGVYNEGLARREVLKEILAQNAQLEKQAKLASTIYSTVSKIKPTVTNLSQVNAFGVNQTAPRRDSRGRFIASGYVPAFGDAQKEESMAKAYGAKNPKAKLIQATIKGKTQPVMVNSEEDVIPNFAGTGDTAIIPRYRKMQDIPRMSSGYIPNFSQEISSAGTSLNQIPGLFKKFGPKLGPRNIDIGGGKYDTGTNFLNQKFGIASRVYDPFNRTKEFNDETLKQFFGTADTATIANVLNVIKEGSAREDLLKFISKSIKPKGSAYFGIYEGNKSGIGAVTSKGYQRNLPADKYLEEISKYFDIKKKTGNYIIGSPLASGYIPNFANEDREILRSIININRLNMASDRFADPRKYKMKTPLYRGVQATSERWRSIDRNDPEAVKKAVFSQVDYEKLIPGYSPKKAFMGSYFEDLMSSHRITPLGPRDIWDEMYRNTRHFGYSRSLPIVSTSKDPSIAYQFSGNSGASSSIIMKNSRILGNESLYKGLYAKYGEDKVREVMFRQSKAGGGRGLGIDFNSLSKSNAFNYEHEVGLFAKGYVPNFAKKDKYKFPNISSAKMEANIARNFEKLSPGDQKYFARAYEDYNNLIKVFSKASGTSPEKFANVMSALSPANPLERNALDALRYNLFAKKKLSTIASPIFLDEREIGSVKAQTYGANRTKAARLIVGLEKLTGNKRKAFLNNMLDPFGSPDVTVDYRAQGDALNKKFNVKNAPTMNREQYDKVSQAFRNVGSRAGVSGLGVQAATWIGGRMGSKAARGQDLNRGILKFFYDNPDKISLENLEFLLNVPAKGKARTDFFKKASAMGVSKLGADSLISISRAGGYIPNFSGLSDAISREKTMTGLPASQIMAHFDGKGNPIAVTNKKDEPNGLKDVVPNFAPKVRVPKGGKGPKGATATEASELFGSFVNNFIYGGLFQSVLSTLADRELISGTVNSAVQIGLPAAIAAFQSVKSFGASKNQKPGVRALAAGIPLALGAAQAGLGFYNAKSVGEDLQRRRLERESDRAAKEFKDLTEGTQELSDTLSKLNEAFKDATTSPEQLSNLSKRASELTRNITKNNPALAASISSEPNIERKINLIEDARRKATQQQAVQQEVIQFKGLAKKSPEDLINLFSKEISLANDKLLQVSKQDLVPQNLDKILAEADLQPLADFFKLQKEEVKNKLVPAFIEAVKSEIDYNKINKENIKKIKALRSEEIKARNEIEGQRIRRQASSEALMAGAGELKPFAGQFGSRAAISFEADLQKTKESITAITSFRNQINTKLIDKELKLPSNIVDSLKGIQTPGKEAGNVLSELSKSTNLNEKQKEALDELIAANANQSKELQKIADISEINKNAQLRVLTIQEKLNYGGGIKTTTDARSRIESINAPIKGILESKLGATLGSERSQTSGMVNVIKSIRDLYPGLVENSKALGSVRDRLTNLRAADLQKDLFRNAALLQSAGGYGDLPGLLRAKAFDSQGLKTLAATQAEAELSGGATPQEGTKYLADVIKDAVSSLNQRMADDQTIKNLEEQTRSPVQKINEETEAARQKFLTSLTDSVKKAFGENIEVQTVNIPNANVNITQSPTYQSGESSGAAQARASMTTMASGASAPRSKGFIPSFYNPLREAIQRESQYVPFSSIRVNKSDKLVNQNNPLGLAVTNTIDEPNGLASIGLASKGYVPNFALFGDKVSKAGLKAAKNGKLYVLDRGYDVYYKVSKSGKVTDKYVEADKLPKDAKIISSDISLAGTKRQDLLKLKDPKITKLDELGLSTVPKSQLLDKEIKRLKKQKQLTPENLLSSIQKMSGGKDVVVKTSFGKYNVAGQGVFGTGANTLSTEDTAEIIKRFKSKKSSGFFIQNKIEGPYLAEARVHAVIDSNGKVKLVKGATVLKDTRGGSVNFKEAGAQLSKAGYGKEGGKVATAYRKAAEATAIKTLRELGKKNPQVRNAMFAVDVGATTLESALAAGVNTKAFDAGKSGKLGTTVFELNPSEVSGSSGYATKGLGVTQNLVNAVLGKNSKPGLAEKIISGTSGLGGRVASGVSGLAGRVGAGVSGIIGKIGAGASSLGGRIATGVSGLTGQFGQGLSQLTGRFNSPTMEGTRKVGGRAFTGGLGLLGAYSNIQQAKEDYDNGRNLESFFSAVAASTSLMSAGLSAFPAFDTGGLLGGSGLMKASSAFSTAAESAREFRAGNYGLGTVKGAEAAAYAASMFGKTVAKAFGIGSALGLGADIATAKNNVLAEDYSDILFGKKDEYINPETGEITKSRSYAGAGFDVFGTAITAMAGGPIGQGVAAFKVGYRAGNVLENKAGIGEKLGKFYEDKINKERAGEIGAAEARLREKKKGLKDRKDFEANIARIEAEGERGRKEVRDQAQKNKADMYKGIEADKEKYDKEKTSFLRRRIIEGVIKNEETNDLSTSKDRANYLISQEAMFGKFRPEDFADKELYKSYKAYSQEKERVKAREEKFNSAAMNPEMAGSQTYKIDQFRAEAERQSAMLASAPKDALEEAVRRGVSVEQVMEERRKINKSRGFIPNFSNAYNREKLDILRNPDYSGYRNAVPQPSKYYKNIVKNSAEIEVPAVEVYNRMGYFGATPKNPSEQYAILNPAQQAKLGYASGGFVPNFAAEQFAGAVSDAMQKALSPLIDKVGTSVNNSNVINVSDQRSYQTSSDQIAGIMEFLYSQFPKEMGRKMGPKLV